MRRLQALPSFRPGIAYLLDTLYLAPTARSPAAYTMRSSRGPSFDRPDAGLAPLPASRTSRALATDSGFTLLPDGTPEPSAEELAALVDEYYAAVTVDGDELGSMGEMDSGVVIQGEGDPLEAITVVLETIRLVAERRNGIAFRLNTLGLCDDATLDILLAADVTAKGDADLRRSSRLASLSVFLPAVEPTKYSELLAPQNGRGFSDVCTFISRAAEAGVDVECTAVARPDVNISDIKRLAMALGARSFRTRSWLG